MAPIVNTMSATANIVDTPVSHCDRTRFASRRTRALGECQALNSAWFIILKSMVVTCAYSDQTHARQPQPTITGEAIHRDPRSPVMPNTVSRPMNTRVHFSRVALDIPKDPPSHARSGTSGSRMVLSMNLSNSAVPILTAVRRIADCLTRILYIV